MNEVTSLDGLAELFSQQKTTFAKAPYLPYEERITALQNLKSLLLDNQQAFIEAINQDFGHRSADDTIMGDILSTVMGINYTLKRLKKWMKPQKKHVGLIFQPAKAKVLYQPLGVVGIIVPWNYPLFLALGPLTAALAAGNCAMLKMSEYTPNTSKLLAELLAKYFSQERVAIVSGEADMAIAFAKLSFNHLFFTGSPAVGKLVMKSAAENLVPVTLELGGKSPAIIDKKIEIKTAVSRFIMGKTLNSGQTCLAPDYIFCPEHKVDELVKVLTEAYRSMFPSIAENNDCSSIINETHYLRLQALLDDAKSKGANVIPLSKEDNDNKLRKMPLTLLLNVNDDMDIMSQEIFGPLLPILPYQELGQVIDYVNARPHPLALYIYSFDDDFQEKLLRNTLAGSVCINEATVHFAVDDLPIGGVGNSGMGSYHGDQGFKTFSHAKSIFSRGRLSLTRVFFPPYGKVLQKLIYKIFIR
ncbi:MAG: coniferyl aldehyde dehydrogenase [Colwellia sp.]|nr:coniferyl aldehyde dehydrogenase [Colwellia sp.]